MPTGLSETRQGRHRSSNLRDAKAAIETQLAFHAAATYHAGQAHEKREQVGSGMRGDKSVTLRFQDDKAQHHGTGKTMKASRYMRGFMDELWG